MENGTWVMGLSVNMRVGECPGLQYRGASSGLQHRQEHDRAFCLQQEHGFMCFVSTIFGTCMCCTCELTLSQLPQAQTRSKGGDL